MIWQQTDYELLETTGEHPFYAIEPMERVLAEGEAWQPLPQSAGRWVDAGALTVGDHVWRADGSTGVVESVEVVAVPQRMYNLTVDVAHTFFVGHGAWLVHNCGGDKLGGRYKDLDAEGGKYQRHHMPANDASPLSLTNGPAILMDPKHHQKTASWGRAASAVKYRAQQAVLIAKGRFDDAVQMDIDDIQRLFGDAYDEHILQMIDSLD